jgi:Zn-dependent protease
LKKANTNPHISGYNSPMENFIQALSIALLPLLFAITVHEVAHGWVALKFGDKTAMMMGRLTLNPIKHIDPIGTVLVPLVLLAMGGFIFGWAKPVPVTWQNLRHPKRDMAFVAVAGPASNLLMAIFWALIVKFGALMGPDSWMGTPLVSMGKFGIFINLVLMVLNLLPLPPLDGGRIMTSILPGPLAWKFSRIEPYGFYILLALLITNVLGMIIGPPIEGLSKLIYQIFIY